MSLLKLEQVTKRFGGLTAFRISILIFRRRAGRTHRA